MVAPDNTIPAGKSAFGGIESLNHDGRGVMHHGGKTVFVEGALPGEEVLFERRRRHASFDEGRLAYLIKASPARVTPGCTHFSICGGCRLQHLESGAQIKAKQQILLDNLKYIGKVVPKSLLPPLTGPSWEYRRKARLGVKYVAGKGGIW